MTAADVTENFDSYQDAATREPVVITEDGRPRTVLLPYEDFMRLRKRDRQVQVTNELSEKEITAVATAEMAPKPERPDVSADD